MAHINPSQAQKTVLNAPTYMATIRLYDKDRKVFLFLFLFSFVFETGFLCIALADLELTL